MKRFFASGSGRVERYAELLGASSATSSTARPARNAAPLGNELCFVALGKNYATGSAEQPASVTPLLTDLKQRQRNRMSETPTEEQRPTAKAKASKSQNKQGLNPSSTSVEQPAAKKQESRLSAESFAAFAAPPRALDASEAASSGSAARPARQPRNKLCGINGELIELEHKEGIAADDLQDLEEADLLLREVEDVASPCPYDVDDYEEIPNIESDLMVQEEESDTTDEGAYILRSTEEEDRIVQQAIMDFHEEWSIDSDGHMTQRSRYSEWLSDA